MFWFRKQTCPVCGQEAKDELTREAKKATRYCRHHLIEEFKKEFLASDSKMLICEPNYNVCTALYGSYSIRDMPKFYFPKEAVQKTSEIISRLDAGLKCNHCQNPAQAIFINSTYFPTLYEKSNGPHVKDLPINAGEPVCLKCAYNRLIQIIQSNQENFCDGGGVYTPYGERCLFVSTYL